MALPALGALLGRLLSGAIATQIGVRSVGAVFNYGSQAVKAFEGAKASREAAKAIAATKPGAAQGATISPAAQSVAQPQAISSLAASPTNFAALLSGKKQPEDIQTEDQDKRQQGHENEAREKSLEGLKNFAKALPPAVSAAVALPLAFKNFAQALAESQRGLSRFNGQIGVAFQKLDQDRIRRSIKSGAATAESTQALTESVSRMEEQLQPVADAITNAKNWIGTALSTITTYLFSLTQIAFWFFKDKGGKTEELKEKEKKPLDMQSFNSIIRDLTTIARNQRRKLPPIE